MKRLITAAFLLAACESTDPIPTTPDMATKTVDPTFTSLYGDYFGNCGQCHSPNAPGRPADIEETLNFTTRATAYSTITTGMASGLAGNHTACNGAPFVVKSNAAQSLIVASVDSTVRTNFDLASHPTCDADAISDMTVKVNSQPSSQFLAALKQWVNDGALDN